MIDWGLLGQIVTAAIIAAVIVTVGGYILFCQIEELTARRVNRKEAARRFAEWKADHEHRLAELDAAIAAWKGRVAAPTIGPAVAELAEHDALAAQRHAYDDHEDDAAPQRFKGAHQ